MLSFIKRLFSKKKTEENQDYSATVYEQWTADFSDPQNRRFVEEEGDGYSSHFDEGLRLSLHRKNLYAWTVNPRYQYRNLFIDTVIDFSSCRTIITETQSEPDNKAGICAFGFLLRYVDENNHLSVLVSDKGFFRLDAVFNGNQMPIIGWTEAPPMHKKYAKHYEMHHIPLQIILNDTSIALIINCSLALLIDNDTIQSEGYIAFAGQNWNDFEQTSAVLSFFSLESRDIQCDAAYRTWASDGSFSSDYRMQLARSLSAVGNIIPSLIQVKKAFAQGITDINDCIFASRLYTSQNLFEEALSIINSASDFFPSEASLIEEKASLFYIWGKYDELSALFKNLNGKEETSAILCSLKGHMTALQQSFEEAYTWYIKASSLDTSQIMHRRNAADMLYKQGREEEYCSALLELLEECIEQKDAASFNEIESSVNEKKLTQGQKTMLLSCRGKKAFLEGKTEEAKILLEKYLSKRGRDSESLFALSLIYKEEGAIDEAETLLQKIVKSGNLKSSYVRTLGECRALQNDTAEALLWAEKALEIDTSDGWAYYLKARLLHEQGNTEQAFEAVLSALSILDEELCVLQLYAQLMNMRGKLAEVLSILDALSLHSGRGIAYRTDALHLCANFYAQNGAYEEADLRYKKALTLSPKDTNLICDYASLCMKTDRINEADSLISGIFTDNIPVKLYEIIASIALKKGEAARAEIALRQGLEDFRDSIHDYCTILISLIHMYIYQNKTDLAEETVRELTLLETSERSAEIGKLVIEKTSRVIFCASCTRRWLVPLSFTSPAVMRLTAEPPSDLPAGNCPVCGKVYCIGCVSQTLSEDGRFSCPECKTSLKIQDKGIYYLLNKWNKEEMENRGRQLKTAE